MRQLGRWARALVVAGVFFAGLRGVWSQPGLPDERTPLMIGNVSPGQWVEGNAGDFADSGIGHPWETVFSWRWQSSATADPASFSDLPGATSRYYRVTEADVGSYLRFVVTMAHKDDPEGPAVEVVSHPEPVLASGGPGAQVRTGAWGRILPDIDDHEFEEPVVLPEPGGKLYVGGDFGRRDYGRTNRIWPGGLLRLDADGGLDESFPPVFEFEGTDAPFPRPLIRDMKRLPDGRIVIVGAFARLNGRDCRNIAVLNPDGTHDAAFASEGTIDGVIERVFVEPDGAFLLSGDFTEIDGVVRPHFARMRGDGAVDADFPAVFPAVQFGPPDVNGVAWRSDGKRLIAGGFTQAGGLPRQHIALLNPDGTVDPAFSPQWGDNSIHHVALLPDDSYYVFTTFATVGGVGPSAVFRFHADGALDESFVVSDPPILSSKWARLLDDGDLLFFTYSGVTESLRPVRIAPDGSVRRWYEAAHFGSGPAAAAATGDGTVYAFFNNGAVAGGIFFERTMRYNAVDGLADREYGVVPGTPGTVEALTVDGAGRVLLGGDFEVEFSEGAPVFGAGGRATTSIARVMPNGLADAAFDPPAFETRDLWGARTNGTVKAIAVFPDGRILAGGDIDTMDGVPAPPLVALREDGFPDPAFAPAASVTGVVTAIAIQADGRILVATRSRYPWAFNPRLIRLLPDGSIDPAFDPSPGLFAPSGAPCTTILTRSDGRILLSGGPEAVVQLLPDGTVDPAFEPAIDGAGDVAEDMELLPDGRLLVIVRNEIYQLLADGSRDPDFAAGPKVPGLPATSGFTALLRQGNGKIAIAHEIEDHAWPGRHFGIIRLQPDGTVDPSFQLRGFREEALGHGAFETGEWRIHALANAPGGNIYAGGLFREIGGLGARSFALIDGGGFPLPENLAGPTLSGTLLPGFGLSGDEGSWKTPEGGGAFALAGFWEMADDALGTNRFALGAAGGNAMVTGDGVAGKFVRFVVRATDPALGPADIVFSEAATAWAAIPAMTQASWREHHFGANPAGEGDADPDGDGKLNVEEYCFGSNPLVPEGDLTEWVCVNVGNEDYPGIAFRSPVGAADVHHVVETSVDFSTWESIHPVSGEDLTVLVSESLNGDGTKTVVRRSVIQCDASPGGYLRLNVGANAPAIGP